jgi:hypothetical protein
MNGAKTALLVTRVRDRVGLAKRMFETDRLSPFYFNLFSRSPETSNVNFKKTRLLLSDAFRSTLLTA